MKSETRMNKAGQRGISLFRWVVCLWGISGIMTGVVPAQAIENRPVIEKVQVDIMGGEPERRAKLHSMATRMMKLHPGDRFDAGALSTSISLLKQSGQFSDIDIPDPDLDAASMTLIFG